MSDLLSQRPQVTDLRGAAGVPRGTAVLEDPTGRRRRRLRLTGRVFATLLTLWLAALLLGSVGINPVSGLPLGRALRPTTPAPAQKTFPQPAAPSIADLKPAKPVQSRASKPASSIPSAPAPRKRALGRSPASKTPIRSAPRSAVPLLSPSVKGPPAPPGRNKTTTTTTGGRSDTAPGQTKAAPTPRAGPRSTTTDTTTTP
jgi:hypothetical protein